MTCQASHEYVIGILKRRWPPLYGALVVYERIGLLSTEVRRG